MLTAFPRGLFDGAIQLDRARLDTGRFTRWTAPTRQNAETQVSTGIKLVIAQEERRKISKRRTSC
jgi:hypothetical protein